MPKAYPYIRFSSDKQKDGLSIQRQTEAIEAYLAANPHLEVDKSLNLEDLGKSGYAGRHLQKGGALYLFLEKIKSGEIEKGSVLIIEHFNRLSRLKLHKAMDLFNEILRHGIDIAVLDEKQIFTAESISSIDYIKAVLKFDLAHEESKDKSKKGKDNWKFKKEALRNSQNPQIERLNFTKTLPLWLEKTDAEIVVNEQKAETIRLIFRLCIENNGYMRIATHLNQSKTPRLDASNGPWTLDIVKRLLHNRALLGEYQPRKTVEIEGRARPIYVPNEEDPIKGVYPAVIDEDTFNAAHNGLTSRKSTGGGRRADMPNLFLKLLKCDECGGSIKFNKHHNGYKQYNYLKCFNSLYGHCVSLGPKTWRYEQFEEMFFKFSGKLNLEDIFKKNEQSKVIQKEITALTAKQNKKKEKVAEILEQIETMEFSKSLYALISKLESETEELETKIKQKYQELSSVKQEELDRRIKDFKDINSLLLQSTEVETREKINNHLRGLIESIALDFKSKTCTIRFKNGIERHIHNDGMFASIPPKAEGEQREKDLDAILNWHNKTEAERQAIYEDADFKIVPLPVSAE
ncbi:TPA: recombinase family protein [Pseudomonas aeruginosa]|uniref:recombinase family protein n=2 Tax=Pseudomonas aeruginosa TaxID=287 RepID=UPI0009470E5B|nr:recombinase family protein [Pseudomonas aeruginosa]EJD6524321.1 recombinase family protein [Pseudomonas aeruginosa]EKT8214704.1 recombinase family protein [Pseudomonas aeruginosa]EKU0600035.1 recombinase family protein [Pseudomonas aeruginosa]EKV5213833.1 recombinase family protein [Pseudomonas aeruginosa]ELI5441504.1 recombinase family protein [Pseudomonas aeruginosa]